MARTHAALKSSAPPDDMQAPAVPVLHEEARSPNGKPDESKNPPRRPGNDRVIIAEDFNAPLSPEEAEMYGL